MLSIPDSKTLIPTATEFRNLASQGDRLSTVGELVGVTKLSSERSLVGSERLHPQPRERRMYVLPLAMAVRC